MQDLLQKHDDDDGSAAPVTGPAAPMDVDPSGFGGATLFAPASKPSTYAEPIPMHAVHPMAGGPEPLNPTWTLSSSTGLCHLPHGMPPTAIRPLFQRRPICANEETFRFNGAAAERKTGDGYFP